MLRKQSIGLLVLRVLVGWVFISEGIQKLCYPGTLGVARFAKIGIPAPGFSAPFVGGVEILCGTLLILGLYTLWACLPLLAIIATAIGTTKVPFFIQHGTWAALHESRTDFSMLLGLVAILCLGAGSISLDYRRRASSPEST